MQMLHPTYFLYVPERFIAKFVPVPTLLVLRGKNTLTPSKTKLLTVLVAVIYCW